LIYYDNENTCKLSIIFSRLTTYIYINHITDEFKEQIRSLAPDKITVEQDEDEDGDTECLVDSDRNDLVVKIIKLAVKFHRQA
jgi:CRISPR/Cas system CMR subunit Cmr4 (Cas7 group RAMP superfamily)